MREVELVALTPSHPKPEPRPKPPRRRVNPVSEQRKAENALRSELRPHWLRRHGVCAASGQHKCFGGLTIHEPWTRGRGGPVDDPRNWATLCAEANRGVSQSTGWMAWAQREGLLFHARAGREWLEAGGRFPGLTIEQAIEEVRKW